MASVEVTSEDKEYPVESACYREEVVGVQPVRELKRSDCSSISRKGFEENEIRRTQEFLLRWSADGGRSFREIVRQQWNFSPPDIASEVEVYQVEIPNITILELIVVPDVSRGAARASVKSLCLS